MKKIIFFLIMAVAFAGIVSALETRSGEICGENYSQETQPFGVSPETVMSEFGVEFRAVTPDTVPVTAFSGPLAVFRAVPDIRHNPGRPQYAWQEIGQAEEIGV
jgi:hypothetical protein